jgi:hypothetical protein
MSEIFSITDFEAQLNSTFQMYINDTTAFAVELIEVRKHGNTQSPYQFSLKFSAPLTAPVAQGIYKMLHEIMGEQHLFLVPIARDAEHLYYEAVFNNPQ